MTAYRGRFAPSPTGQLHIGSLIGALASFLDARANNGQWLMRMEDLDPPREVPGAAQAILTSLQDHGLQWDGDVLWQSQRHEAYRLALDTLLDRGQAFYCTCSRRDLERHQGIYSGHCRGRQQQPDQPFAIRLQVDDTTIDFIDAIQGRYSQQLARQVGDVVLLRKDKLFSYQLAVVIDDQFQQINHVLRGSDLLDSTPRQIFLQRQLGFAQPRYAHIPVITNLAGQKLSKQTFAKPLDNRNAARNLMAALSFLKQPLPPSSATIEQIIEWAIAHWTMANIPARTQIYAPYAQ